MLVLVENGEAVDVLDRDHRIPEAAFFPRFRGALLALHRVSIDVVAGEAVLGRDQIGRDALRHEVGRHRHRRIHRPRRARRHDADTAHGFRAAADCEFVLARHHLRRGEIHRIESRRAKTVDLHARHRGAEAGIHGGKARDVAAGLADRIDHAENDIIDTVLRQVVALLERLQRRGGERQRRHLMQRTIDLAPAAWSADVIVDKGLRHFALSVVFSLGPRQSHSGTNFVQSSFISALSRGSRKKLTSSSAEVCDWARRPLVVLQQPEDAYLTLNNHTVRPVQPRASFTKKQLLAAAGQLLNPLFTVTRKGLVTEADDPRRIRLSIQRTRGETEGASDAPVGHRTEP